MTRDSGRFYGASNYHPNEDTNSQDTWLPGERIPLHRSTTYALEELKTTFHSMMSSLQTSVSSELAEIQTSLVRLDERMTDMEGQLQSSRLSSLSSACTPCSSSEENSLRRKRRTSVDIQVKYQAHKHV